MAKDYLKAEQQYLVPIGEDRTEGSVLHAVSPKKTIIVTIALAIVYFFVLTFWFPRGNSFLFFLLIASELFHLWQLLTYCHTIWETRHRALFDSRFRPHVDVFITVAGEPLDIIEETVRACLDLDYPDFSVFILNDGYVAKKDNWREVYELARDLGANCITRRIPGGAKAGNINNALRETEGAFIAVFDADHVPHPDFLSEVMGYFGDSRVAFVQTPQFYKNYLVNNVTGGAWEQQDVFFRAILNGKNRLNSVFMCGTNMVIRRAAILDAGGMTEKNITEDFVTSLFMHQKGWKSLYVPKILAEGLAPEDFLSYVKQQYRWARGSLEIIFVYNPFFKRGLSLAQKIQYLSSAGFYLSGPVVLINALLPVAFFFFGAVPVKVNTMLLAAVFLPYIVFTLLVLGLSTSFNFTFRAVSLAMGAFMIQIRAIVSTVLRTKAQFLVTPKRAQEANSFSSIVPHLFYISLVFAGISFAVYREGFNVSLLTNSAWAFYHIALFVPYIASAIPSRSAEIEKVPERTRVLAAEE